MTRARVRLTKNDDGTITVSVGEESATLTLGQFSRLLAKPSSPRRRA